MKQFAVIDIVFLWILHISAVNPIKLVPFGIFHKPISSRLQTRVYGGTTAKQGEYPFMILVQAGKNICSASLVSPNWVLTAAHCFQFLEWKANNVILAGGQSDLRDYALERKNINWEDPVNETKFNVEERRAEAIFSHPDYLISDDEIKNDIALIKLKKPFTNKFIKTIPLCFDKIYKKKNCTILGFGKTSFGEQYLLKVVERNEISTTSIGCKYNISHPLICLKSDQSGMCRGDSGSPLVCGDEVWGVASYVLTESIECGDSVEEYFTELSVHKDWIQGLINIGSEPVQINGFLIFTFIFTNFCVCCNILN